MLLEEGVQQASPSSPSSLWPKWMPRRTSGTTERIGKRREIVRRALVRGEGKVEISCGRLQLLKKDEEEEEEEEEEEKMCGVVERLRVASEVTHLENLSTKTVQNIFLS
jgi:hypothetical protein